MRKAFVRTLSQLAANDKRIVLLTGDLGFSLLEEYRDQFPEQFLNVGLSEQCMVGMAAGMALEGYSVFVYSIAPFIVCRALEQIRNDLCYQRLPVKLIGVGSGLAYGAEGGTHHAVDDLGLMTTLPDMIVIAPGDPLETEMAVKTCLDFDMPCYIRLNRSGDPLVHTAETVKGWVLSKPLHVCGATDANVVVVACGNTVPLALDLFRALQVSQISSRVLSMHTLKPVDGETVQGALSSCRLVVSLEEHVSRNGLAGLLRCWVSEERLLEVSLGDSFGHEVGSQAYLRREYGLDVRQLVSGVAERLRVVQDRSRIHR